ncbi:Recombinase [Paramagnetospirillum magnetotacticum MS-1]|uniref:Recombinase n=1 Tax=Paramagnetospirillum magnetotacticum MS-1 TaxID=272627 RepID=A0A0C2YLB3_PARME|nr:recombinase family protein [Paramagnetospirillum magnetotacticum]KIM00565.1 Recombinase [Paramagnetospirillum magnetotacticum MS-1]
MDDLGEFRDREKREGGIDASTGVRAAQYVRMSTEHQRYSTENQADIIAQYAARRGIAIVRTYADEGKSGLSIDGRDALKLLIHDVEAGNTDFTTILVYDISRWGRFQDADESAYYEHVCKRAGITVQFCAEQFENDGSLSATIIKGMKRAMAGEYSRELSVKVFTGQCRLIELGYRQGGAAGFGLRRMLLDERGSPKGILTRGEHKSLQTDRVVLVPGPPDEVEIVQRIYSMFVDGKKTEGEIAAILNAEGLSTDYGRPWTRGTIHQVLSNEKYVGNNVFNRMSFKLKKKRVHNGADIWIRRDGAFPAIVPIEMFRTAGDIIVARSVRYSDGEMLDRLAGLLADRGELSGLIIDEMDGMPSSSAYRSRFGSLLRAYQLVGYAPGRDYRYVEINRFLRRMHPDIVERAITAIEDLGGTVRRDLETDLLAINGEFTASIVIVRCQETQAGALRWKIRFDAGLRPDITVAIRMAAGNQEILDYYLLPRTEMMGADLRLKEDNGIFLDAFRFDTLDRFFKLTARCSIWRAA